jgi:Protein of unknown function (DUF2950)
MNRVMNRVLGAFALVLVAAYAPSVSAQQPNQKTFSSPDQATEALFLAAQAGDEKGLSQVLGAGKEILSAGDDRQDEFDRQRFVEKYREMHRLVPERHGTVLYVGAENWPFPVPLVSRNGVWSFDAQTGMREVLLRRIGANEWFAIDVCRGLGQLSDEGELGKRDAASIVGNPVPFNGYYFRALPAREGQRRSFVAYPAEYGSSGVMTFLVSHDGTVYERNLGPRTADVAKTITSDKPDTSWRAVQ